MRKLFGAIALLIAGSLVAACSISLPTWLGGTGSQPPAQSAPAPVAPAPAPLARTLFPEQDRQYRFSIRDAGGPPYEVREYLLRAGDANPAVQSGSLYAVWVLNPEGVWRADPKGGATLLRYLPAQLKDGEAWKQSSGNAQVWFRLAENKTACTRGSCWDLTVLNRGERLIFRFAPGEGPSLANSENWAAPEQSYEKSLVESGDSRLAPNERTRLLEQASKAAIPAAAPVVPASSQEFDQALQQMMAAAPASKAVTRADLDGDRKEELIRGPLGVWTSQPVVIQTAAGYTLGQYGAAAGGQHRMELIRPAGLSRPVLLHQTRTPGQVDGVGIVTAVKNGSKPGGLELQASYGWEFKGAGTPANRVKMEADGAITVEWDLGDPARHTRIRKYRLKMDADRVLVQVESTAFVPQGKELLMPSTPEDLLQAAFFARWYKLEQELPRYFATAEAAAAFAQIEGVDGPDYGPGAVKLGKVAPIKEGECSPAVTPASQGPDGTIGFAAMVGGYEWCSSVWGTVTFSKDAQGGLRISAIKSEGKQINSH